MYHVLPSLNHGLCRRKKCLLKSSSPTADHGCRNIFILHLPLWLCQVSVKIDEHQQRIPPGLLADGRDDVLYFRGVVWGQVVPHNVPPLAARHQMKAHGICAVEMERLHGEILFRTIEHGNAPAVCAWRL